MKPKKEVLSNKFVSYIFNNLTSLIVNKFIKRIEGEENILKRGPYIMAVNHVSIMDTVVVHNIFTKNTNYKLHLMVTTSLKFLWWIFGGKRFLRWSIGFIPTPEYKGKKVKVPSVDVALDILKKGGVIGIAPYPKSDPREKIRVKTGVARLALLAKVPVVPVALMGTYSVLGSNKKPKLPKTYKKVIKVKIGKPLYFDKYYHLICKDWNKNRKLFRTVSEQIVNKIENMRKSIS